MILKQATFSCEWSENVTQICFVRFTQCLLYSDTILMFLHAYSEMDLTRLIFPGQGYTGGSVKRAMGV